MHVYFLLINILQLCSEMKVFSLFFRVNSLCVCPSRHVARRAGSDGSMSASGSAGPGFDPLRGSKF